MPSIKAKLRAPRALRAQPRTLAASQLRVQLVRQAKLLRQQALLSAPTAIRARLLPQQAVLYALIVPLPIIKRQLVKLRAPAPVPRAGLGPRAHVPNVRVALMPRLPAKLRAPRALREQPRTLPAAQLYALIVALPVIKR